MNGYNSVLKKNGLYKAAKVKEKSEKSQKTIFFS